MNNAHEDNAAMLAEYREVEAAIVAAFKASDTLMAAFKRGGIDWGSAWYTAQRSL